MSLYDTESWTVSTYYPKNYVVWGTSSSPYYYYSLVDHTSTTETSPANDTNGLYWGGRTWHKGAQSPHFLWLPSYGLTVRQSPRVKVVKFGDGYEQRTPDGVTTNPLEIDYSFENRDAAEAKAILHFLDQRAASEFFIHTPIAPYDSAKKFVCRSWDHTLVFIDNYTIRAKFEEVS